MNALKSCGCLVVLLLCGAPVGSAARKLKVLFITQTNRHQFTNLSGNPQHQQIAAELQARLDDKLNAMK